jgi:hypothetical protein
MLDARCLWSMGNKILDKESNCIGWFPNLQKAMLIYFWGTKLRHLKPLVAFCSLLHIGFCWSQTQRGKPCAERTTGHAIFMAP